MGYETLITHCDITIPFDRHEEALAALRAHNIGRPNYDQFVGLDNEATLPEVLVDRYEIYHDADANFTEEGDWFKDRQAEDFFRTIAPFVVDGGTIDWKGEDGDRWRYYFKRGELHSVDAVVTFPEPD